MLISFSDLLKSYPLTIQLIMWGVAIVLGWVFAYIFYRRSLSHSSISLVYNPDIQLLHSFANVLSELKLTYKGKEVSKGMIAIIFSLVNTGKRDVQITSTNEALEFKLPDHLKWKQFRIAHEPEGLGAQYSFTDPSHLSLWWRLLKVDECITCFALVDYSSEITSGKSVNTKSSKSKKQVIEQFDISHRIPNTVLIRQSINPHSLKKESIYNYIAIVVVGLLTALFLANEALTATGVEFIFLIIFVVGLIMYSVGMIIVTIDLRVKKKLSGTVFEHWAEIENPNE